MNVEEYRKHHFDDELEPRVYAGEWRIPAGKFAVSHAHNEDHFSILACGRAVVEVDGEHTYYRDGDIILIKAGKVHRVNAIDDIVWFCIHPTQTADVPALLKSLVEA